VAVLNGLLALLELLALAVLPCLLTLVLTADEALIARVRSVVAFFDRCRRRCFPPRPAPSPAEPQVAPAGPPIEQLAADLRRLHRQRTSVATRSPVWFAAVQRAYDERLSLACRELGIAEHLDELTGLDLDIERVRIEGMLAEAGLWLPSEPADRRQDQR
jgi:hypothetical protein